MVGQDCVVRQRKRADLGLREDMNRIGVGTYMGSGGIGSRRNTERR